MLNPSAREACVLCLDDDAPYVELMLLRATHELSDPDALSFTFLPPSTSKTQRARVEAADWVVLVVSPEAMRSDALRAEAGAAYESEPDRVICLTMPGGDPLGLHPDLARGTNILVDPDSPAITHDRLAEAVRTMVDTPVPVAQNAPVAAIKGSLIQRRADSSGGGVEPSAPTAKNAVPPGGGVSDVAGAGDVDVAIPPGPTNGVSAAVDDGKPDAKKDKKADKSPGTGDSSVASNPCTAASVETMDAKKPEAAAGEAAADANVDALLETLAKGKSEDRWQAVAGLRKVGEADPRVLPALLGALEDKDALVRRRAVRALRETGSSDDRVKVALRGALKDHAGMVRRQAAECLREMGEAVDQEVLDPPPDAKPTTASPKSDDKPTADSASTADKSAAKEPASEPGKGTKQRQTSAADANKADGDSKPTRKKTAAGTEKKKAGDPAEKKTDAKGGTRKASAKKGSADEDAGLIRFVGAPEPAEPPAAKKTKRAKPRTGKTAEREQRKKPAKTDPALVKPEVDEPSLPDTLIPRAGKVDKAPEKTPPSVSSAEAEAPIMPPMLEADPVPTLTSPRDTAGDVGLSSNVTGKDSPKPSDPIAPARPVGRDKLGVSDGLADHLFGPTLGGPISQDFLNVRAPATMRIGRTGTVDAHVMRDTLPAMMATLRGENGETDNGGSPVAALMWAELEGEAGAFQIDSRDSGPYLIDHTAAGDASWQWRVTPVKRGKQSLTVRLRGHAVNGGGVTAEFSLLPVSRKVRVRGNQWSALFRMLGWLVVLCAFAAAGMYAEHRTRTVDSYLERPASDGRDTPSGNAAERQPAPAQDLNGSGAGDSATGSSSAVTVPILPIAGDGGPEERPMSGRFAPPVSGPSNKRWGVPVNPATGAIVPAGLPAVPAAPSEPAASDQSELDRPPESAA